MKKAASVLGRVFLGFILFLTLVPFYLLLSNSFKWSEEIVKKPFTLPAEWHFTNYAKSVVQVIHPMANTLLVTICVIVIVLIVGTLAAYTFVRFHFKGSTFLYLAIMALLMIPGFVLLIPQFIQITRLQMYNTFWGLIFPPAAASSATATFLLRTSMEGLSKSLFEAADMEGAGDLQILTKIVVPLSKPTISTVTIMTGLFCLEQLSLAAGFHNGRKYPADRSSADQTGPLFRRRKRNHVCRLCDGITSADPAVLFRK